MQTFQKVIVWVAIALPPTLMVVLSLAPFDIAAIWFFGVLALSFLLLLLAALRWVPALRPQKRLWRQATAAMLLVVSIMVFNWPLRIGYAFSKPAFNQVAEQVKAGNIPDTPRRVGWFLIEEIDAPNYVINIIGHDVVCLWTDVHPFGNTGFVQHGPDNLPFNIWTHFKLDNTWQFIAED